MAGARKVLGIIITLAGLVLLAYAFYEGAVNGSIGNAGETSKAAWSAILGWFAILIGPALWEGETPVSIKRKLAGR